jgi:hypothetical protein
MFPVSERPARTANFYVVLNGLKMGSGVLNITAFGEATEYPTAMVVFDPRHTPSNIMTMIETNKIE